MLWQPLCSATATSAVDSPLPSLDGSKTMAPTPGSRERLRRTEVVQVYVAPSAQIREAGEMSFPKTLAGFCKIAVPAGVSREVSIPIRGSELSWYDTRVAQWRLDAGKYACWVGRSSSQIDAELKIEVAEGDDTDMGH
ncbi:hypothetical protein BO79DRAFT_287184 [Aspergillus costaricaensis CBS 115574]|uniref:Uncharacterized protein n=1 Tax=Aspergillus costaricaensis CBS 115574 TaxID=1448317 RepID=A0ACD1IHD4_9EURO|nr:hypothetical protein BO79DRAFT_287184 [Aspergillus costaricaensis CBS 115574]RAK89706.1 hypothetical protein BO79DRAFT_287184 [Aspergillus costaricaensis CBS 115574]